MKLCFIDSTGLRYTGDTLLSRGLGGSESAVIYMSRELAKLGFDVTVYNRCEKEGIYDGVTYIDFSKIRDNKTKFDILISSRSVLPLAPQELGEEIWNTHQVDIGPYETISPHATYKAIWAHDTFIEGEGYVEPFLVSGVIDELFLLSDWHTHYICQSDHWGTQKRDYAVLKDKVFNTRNGMHAYVEPPNGYLHKDINSFVYNSSAGKGLVTLVKDVWPDIKRQIPDAKLTVIGGYYSGIKDIVEKDEGERIWNELQTPESERLDIHFTGVVTPKKVDEILISASFLIYPPEFPETYGISTIEALYYGVLPITSDYGALEQTSIDRMSFKIPYPVLPGNRRQRDIFVKQVLTAYTDTYACDQKRQACEEIRDVVSWETVAKQWQAHFYKKLGKYLPRQSWKEVRKITSKINRLFGTRHINDEDRLEYFEKLEEQRLIIISPVWNAQEYIAACIESVASQVYDNYHHYIVDDVSTDNTAAIAEETILALPEDVRDKFSVIRNRKRIGALHNQMVSIERFAEQGDVIVLLDGDDNLYHDPDIFTYINQLYPEYEMSYGSCISMADGIELIGQEYPEEIRVANSYRTYRPFPWGIPHTHLRTFSKDLYDRSDHSKLLDKNGNVYGPAGDSALMYMLLEEVDPYKIKAVKRVLVNYNDLNSLNDYKVNTEEQNINTREIAGGSFKVLPTVSQTEMKRILIAIPTAKYIESKTFKSIYNLYIPAGCETHFEVFYGYNIAQVRNLMADYAIRDNYDYVFWVDSDIILSKNTLLSLYSHQKDYVSGVYIQRRSGTRVPEVYLYNHIGGMDNANIDDLKDQGLKEVAATGFGCVLTTVDMIREIGYPQFEYKNSLDHMHTISEDVDFCVKAQARGYTIYTDTDVLCGHIGEQIHEV